MKIHVYEIVAANQVLNRIRTLALPPRGAFAFDRLSKKIEEEMKTIDERRVAIVKELGKPNGDGSFHVPDDKMEEFWSKWNPILEEEIEAEMPSVKLSHFGDVSVKPEEIRFMSKFIIED